LDKKLSIIIPHYNSIDFLIQLLNSIPASTWIQIIVVDDNSPVQLDELKLKYLHVEFYICPKEKKGAGAARNIGLSKAIGKWLIFADSDDYFTNESFKFIHSHLSTKADVIYFRPESFNVSLNQPGTRHKIYAELLKKFSNTHNKTLLYKFFVPWSKMISKELIDKNQIKFDEIIASNDMNFSLKVAFFSQKSLYDDNCIYVVTESDNSLTKQVNEEVIDSRFYAICRYNQFLKDYRQPEYRLSTNMMIYSARHVGVKKMVSFLIYSIKHKQPIHRGLKPLFKLIYSDIRKKVAN